MIDDSAAYAPPLCCIDRLCRKASGESRYVFRHFVVRFVEGDFVSAVRNNVCFQAVALQDTRHAAVIPESVHMSGDRCGQLRSGNNPVRM